MNLSIKHVLHEMANTLTTELPQYAGSFIHKSFTYIGGASAAYKLSPGGTEYIPDFMMPMFNWLWHIDWLQMFTTYAVLALCVERTCVIFAWAMRFRRGDYDAGKPQDNK